jgi:hypothetical protein
LQADYAAIVDGMKKAGIGAEFFKWLKNFASSAHLSPLSVQRNLFSERGPVFKYYPFFRVVCVLRVPFHLQKRSMSLN